MLSVHACLANGITRARDAACSRVGLRYMLRVVSCCGVVLFVIVVVVVGVGGGGGGV